MQFNSFIFFFSITIFIFLYFILKNKYRKAALLIGNLLFYLSFGLQGLMVLILILIITYFSGLFISKRPGKKSVLLLCVLSVLIFLIIFKYYNFFISFFGTNDYLPALKLTSPIGLSFYTFSSLSYVFEVYRQRIKAETNILSLAQFITFFPLIVSGPIERPYNLLPQFNQEKNFDYDRVKSGLMLVTLGFFKKIVVADRLADLVDKVFDNPSEFKGIALIVGAVLFSIQIYCDFSGYTDIAIGIARIMGFNVLENFNLPYYSKSIQEFWSRWHITLSNWLRDYVFLPVAYSVTRRLNNKPLLGFRPEMYSYLIGVTITMFICGLWHGANWTFIAWGIMHGLFLIFAFITKKFRNGIWKKVGLEKSNLKGVFKIAFTFSLVTFAWVFFRANSLNDGFYIVTNFFVNFDFKSIMKIFSSRLDLYIVISLIILLELVHIIQWKFGVIDFLNRRPAWQRWGIYYLFIFTILIFGRFESASFIYAKF